MEMMSVIGALALMVVGIVFGVIFGFKVGESRLDKVKRAGYLVVDARAGEKSDVYLQIGAEPGDFEDGEWVLLQISKVSQDKQG